MLKPQLIRPTGPFARAATALGITIVVMCFAGVIATSTARLMELREHDRAEVVPVRTRSSGANNVTNATEYAQRGAGSYSIRDGVTCFKDVTASYTAEVCDGFYVGETKEQSCVRNTAFQRVKDSWFTRQRQTVMDSITYAQRWGGCDPALEVGEVGEVNLSGYMNASGGQVNYTTYTIADGVTTIGNATNSAVLSGTYDVGDTIRVAP